jgi:hypothetical protein
MATAQGQFRSVAGPAMARAGAGEPDLANWLLLNSTTVLLPALGTHRSPAELMATSPGLKRLADEMTTAGAGEPDLASCALVNLTALLPL